MTETKTTKKPAPDKLDQLDSLVAATNKEHGENALMRLGDEAATKRMPCIPTGALSLDSALGIGGYPRGRIVEIFGPESSGKTTLTLHAIAPTQKAGGNAAFMDAEHAFDLRYAKEIGRAHV